MRWESPSRPLVVYPPPSIKFNFFSQPIFLFLDRYDKANDILNILKPWRNWLSYYKDRRSRMAEPRPKHPTAHGVVDHLIKACQAYFSYQPIWANDILNILKLWRDWLSYYKDRRLRMAEPRPKHQIEPRSHPIYRILLDLECTLLAGRSYQAIRLRITTMSAIDFRCAPSLSLDSRGPDNIILSNRRTYHLALKHGEVANQILTVGDHVRARRIAKFLDPRVRRSLSSLVSVDLLRLRVVTWPYQSRLLQSEREVRAVVTTGDLIIIRFATVTFPG
ncbi:hypothetical protein PGT21_015463 [Puccinia graminis f. sp. tritici]|uniref:Uncharacterized protein n=1 Tax=Puccinia graminis f. sp. tritici TaxID=56615 RepID=A0A5B0PR85_PUCGR|nr:hypothetical protein PGT21_015463 [Puccinia graminis f. sp. tritici]